MQLGTMVFTVVRLQDGSAPESFAFLLPTAAPVAELPNRLPSPGDHLNSLENKAFSGDLEGAQAEHSGVFSPDLRILSKA